MGPKHSREDILRAALAVAEDDGISSLSFGRVGQRMGISDRTVVYYFPTKDDLIGAVLLQLGVDLQLALEPAFAEPGRDHRELLQRAWPVLRDPTHDRTFALFFEANGLASVGRDPYRVLVPQLVGLWVDWVAERLADDVAERRAEAEAVIAVLDGLLLLRQLAGGDTADRAAARLGIA